jgi:hypothetical protein
MIVERFFKSLYSITASKEYKALLIFGAQQLTSSTIFHVRDLDLSRLNSGIITLTNP